MFGRGLRLSLAVTVAGLALVVLLLAMVVVAWSAEVAAAPLDTLYWCGGNTYCNIALQSGDGITASQVSENAVRQGGSIVFNRAELYCTMDEGSIQTQTVKLQYSADNTNWIDHASGACSQQTADGTVGVSITSLSGVYWRGYITLVGSNLTTPTVRLVLKRTQ
jgi:hypothetical protein